MQRLVLLYGGRSSEHEISVRSASQVLAAVDRQRFAPVVVGIRRDGEMRTGGADRPLSEVLEVGEPVADLRALGGDIFFPLLHGPFGEDGRIQGLLETWELPYVGCGVASSALCMDKAFLKHVARAHAVPVVPDIEFRNHELAEESQIDAAVSRAVEEIGFPCFIKPANQGSSIGVARAENVAELRTALLNALRYDNKLLVERGINAREVELAVLGNGDAETLVSAPGEIVLPQGSWYDYDNKYENDVAGIAIPADLSGEVVERLRALTRRVFLMGECRGLSRIDFLLDRDSDAIYLNEVNTMPGFTQISMYPKLMAHSGVEYAELITQLCELGLAAARERDALHIHGNDHQHG